MITAVDTNILIDVFGADARYGLASADALRRCIAEGSITACPIVWAEAAQAFRSERAFLNAMQVLGVAFSDISQESALAAAGSWRQYRATGGKRQRVAPDFLIGAHAMIQCGRLLTRDRGFYRSYFRKLSILDPTA